MEAQKRRCLEVPLRKKSLPAPNANKDIQCNSNSVQSASCKPDIHKKDALSPKSDFLLPDIYTDYIISVSCGNTPNTMNTWAFLKVRKRKKLKVKYYWR